VPPSFHQSSLESSLFGIQPSDGNEGLTESRDPETRTARDEAHDKTGELSQDRSKWKTLRDFIDERGIEDVLDSTEEERNALDEILAATATHPATITSTTARIRALLSTSLSGSRGSIQHRESPLRMVSPAIENLPPVEKPQMKDMSALLALQERTSAGMASHLESLAAHYDQMATALKEKEAGEDLGNEDMEGM
jgi:autophagy-related protein 17